jgi:hypothetical protein
MSGARFSDIPRQSLGFRGMASTKDKVQKALSEVRTLVLGAQILLGFDYRALFLPRFEDLPGYGKAARHW